MIRRPLLALVFCLGLPAHAATVAEEAAQASAQLTEAVAGFYRQMGANKEQGAPQFVTVNGTQAIDAIKTQILSGLEKLA